MELNRYKKKNHKTVGIILFTLVCVFFIVGVILYQTYAIYEVIKDKDLLNGEVEDPGDIYFAFYKDDVLQKEMPKKDSGYVLDEENSTCGVMGVNDTHIKVSLTENWDIVVSGVTNSRTKCNLRFVRGAYILGKAVKSVTKDDGLYEVTHGDEVSKTLNDNGFKQTEWRYAGANPNNYINFNCDETGTNCEPWRIIGLVNVMTDTNNTVEQRVKIIREDNIGLYSWDAAGNGVNDWNQSDIVKLLNPNYSQEPNGGSLYWDHTKGNCYTDKNKTLTPCDFESNGLKENTKKYIDSTIIWNIGSNGSDFAWNAITAYNFYNMERSANIGCILHTGNTCQDDKNRNITWQGAIGLMYSSDYGFATTGSENRSRENCLKNYAMYKWSSNDDCRKNDWILQKREVSKRQWTMTPSAIDDGYTSAVFSISEVGHLTFDMATEDLGVQPVVYLKPEVHIISGTGESTHPFEVSIK